MKTLSKLIHGRIIQKQFTRSANGSVVVRVMWPARIDMLHLKFDLMERGLILYDYSSWFWFFHTFQVRPL